MTNFMTSRTITRLELLHDALQFASMTPTRRSSDSGKIDLEVLVESNFGQERR